MAATSSKQSLTESRHKNESRGKEKAIDSFLISLEKLNLGPSKKLLVLDLNGLLFQRFHFLEKETMPKYRKPDGIFNNQLVFKRPFCEEFLKFCFERFEVGIWSSAMAKNVKGPIDFVMGALKSKILFNWDQVKCTNTGFKTKGKPKPLFLKELKKLWNKEDSSLPWRSGRFSPSNTLLIDDTPYKALLNPPNTAIFPLPYMADDKGDSYLGAKGELRIFLDGLVEAADVQSYVKKNSIGQSEITDVHPDWNFYSKVVNALA